MATAHPINVLGLDHVVLRAADPAAMEAFYCNILGATVAERDPDNKLTQLRLGRSLIDLLEVGEVRDLSEDTARAGNNMDHLCLRVEPWDLDAINAFLAEHGVEPGEVKQRGGAEGEGPGMYIRDPEGNQVELKGPTDEF